MKKNLYKLRLSDDAENDFDCSYQYYLKISKKVADNFLKLIDSSFKQINSNPLSYPVVFENIIKYIVKKYPFVVYYEVTSNSIEIIAVFHSSRNPQVWKNRIT